MMGVRHVRAMIMPQRSMGVGRTVERVRVKPGKLELAAGMGRALTGAAILVLSVLAVVQNAHAQKIENDVAVFASLDKVTARIKPLEIRMGETAQFGALKVTPRICHTRPATEAPLTSVFVEVDEIKLSGETQRIFTGWMFAQSPGLHAVEHPVFDVWLTSCKTDSGG